MQDPHFKPSDDTDGAGPPAAPSEADLQRLEARVAELEACALRYHRLLSDLRCDDGPLSLRMVLPLARVMRRLRRGRSRETAHQPALSGPSQAGSAPSRSATFAGAVLRPITRRLRGYLHEPIVPVSQKLDAIAHDLDALRRRLDPEEPRDEKATGTVPASPELLRSIEALLLTIAARAPRDGSK